MPLLILGIILIVGSLTALRVSAVNRKSSSATARSAATLMHLGGIIGAVIGLLLTVGSSVRVVPANSVGIPTQFGSIGEPMSSGLHVVAPWTQINTFSTRVQESSMLDVLDEGDRITADAIEVRGSDGYLMRVDITIRFFVVENSASELFRLVGSMDGIRERLVRPEARESVRVQFASFTAEEGYTTAREAIRTGIESDLRTRLDKYGLNLDTVNVRNVAPDPALAQAISDRATAREKALQAEIAQQQALTEAETRRQVAKKDAEAKVIAAQAEADANTILTKSLDGALLELKRIEALRDANTVYVPADASIITGAQPANP